MNQIKFFKYQATGNDFVLIDNRDDNLSPDNALIATLCDRKFGIGSDGLILIENHDKYDFNMVFHNPDGSQSLCGNGSRCAVAFAQFLGIIENTTEFLAYDGSHKAEILSNGEVRLKMSDVQNVSILDDGTFVDTGSPHLVQKVTDVQKYQVYEKGKQIRNNDTFKTEGVNINFIEKVDDNKIFVRTYERGVENETLSCGTGVTASAIAASLDNVSSPVSVCTKGGNLAVDFVKENQDSFTNVYLTGPAKQVFEGTLEIDQILGK